MTTVEVEVFWSCIVTMLCVENCNILCFIQFQGGIWSLDTVICDGLMTMDVMLCTASIFNLCAISIDRFVLLTVI